MHLFFNGIYMYIYIAYVSVCVTCIWILQTLGLTTKMYMIYPVSFETDLGPTIEHVFGSQCFFYFVGIGFVENKHW